MTHEELRARYEAHRAVHAAEHDPAHGRLHGCCLVCGVPWPCEYAGSKPGDLARFEIIEPKHADLLRERDEWRDQWKEMARSKWSQLKDAERERDAARAEVERLKREGSPGVLHAVDQAFLEVTVKERNAARSEAATLRAEVERLRGELEVKSNWETVAVAQNEEPVEPVKCSRCGGSGWVWRHELDTPIDPSDPSPDDTRYSCPDCQRAEPKPPEPAWTEEQCTAVLKAGFLALRPHTPGWTDACCAAIAKVAPLFAPKVRVKLPTASIFHASDGEALLRRAVVVVLLREQGVEVDDA